MPARTEVSVQQPAWSIPLRFTLAGTWLLSRQTLLYQVPRRCGSRQENGSQGRRSKHLLGDSFRLQQVHEPGQTGGWRDSSAHCRTGVKKFLKRPILTISLERHHSLFIMKLPSLPATICACQTWWVSKTFRNCCSRKRSDYFQKAWGSQAFNSRGKTIIFHYQKKHSQAVRTQISLDESCVSSQIMPVLKIGTWIVTWNPAVTHASGQGIIWSWCLL